jgi:hypothetical protein
MRQPASAISSNAMLVRYASRPTRSTFIVMTTSNGRGVAFTAARSAAKPGRARNSAPEIPSSVNSRTTVKLFAAANARALASWPPTASSFA